MCAVREGCFPFQQLKSMEIVKMEHGFCECGTGSRLILASFTIRIQLIQTPYEKKMPNAFCRRVHIRTGLVQ